MMNKTWISAHIFYHDDLQLLLKEGIHPLISELTLSHSIECFFFIRYWDGGSHVRLRLLPAPDVDKEALIEVLEERIQTFFAIYPSTTSIQENIYLRMAAQRAQFEDLPDYVQSLYPNNSIQYIPYVPEFHRYGGSKAMPAVERHFMDSSKLVLDLIAQGGSRNKRAGQALSMMLLGLAVYESDLKMLAHILDVSYARYSKMLGLEKSTYTKQFTQQYQQQREHLHRLVEQLTRLTREESLLQRDTLMENWINSLLVLKAQLFSLAQQGVLRTQEHGQSIKEPSRAVNQYDPMSIMLHCLHMNTNRLGILPEEETYLFYLLKCTLAEIAFDRR